MEVKNGKSVGGFIYLDGYWDNSMHGDGVKLPSHQDPLRKHGAWVNLDHISEVNQLHYGHRFSVEIPFEEFDVDDPDVHTDNSSGTTKYYKRYDTAGIMLTNGYYNNQDHRYVYLMEYSAREWIDIINNARLNYEIEKAKQVQKALTPDS